MSRFLKHYSIVVVDKFAPAHKQALLYGEFDSPEKAAHVLREKGWTQLANQLWHNSEHPNLMAVIAGSRTRIRDLNELQVLWRPR